MKKCIFWLLTVMASSMLICTAVFGKVGTVLPEDFEIHVFNEIRNKIQGKVEQGIVQQEFLSGLIRQERPKKILELGVAHGGSSAIILNAIKDIDGSHLYSIDKNKMCYRKKDKKSGYVVSDMFPELMNKWTLYTGDIAANFMDKIGNDIDFVFIDTVHTAPGEFLDFLEVLPYLKENAMVVFHDTAYHRIVNKYFICPNSVLYSTIKGKKIHPTRGKGCFENIGAIKLSKNQKDSWFDYFYLLDLQWSYNLPEKEVTLLNEFFLRHYGSEYVDMFKKSTQNNMKFLNSLKKGTNSA